MIRKTYILMYLVVYKGVSNDDVGVARDTVLREIRPGAGFQSTDFVNEKLGGATLDSRVLEAAVLLHSLNRATVNRGNHIFYILFIGPFRNHQLPSLLAPPPTPPPLLPPPAPPLLLPPPSCPPSLFDLPHPVPSPCFPLRPHAFLLPPPLSPKTWSPKSSYITRITSAYLV